MITGGIGPGEWKIEEWWLSMDPVLKKLGYSGQDPALVIDAPPEYRRILDGMTGEVHPSAHGRYGFIQVFAQSLAEAGRNLPPAARALAGGGYLWLCYPKGTSRKYRSDLNRNTAWSLLAPYDFEPVTQVAVDEDWSALRFKPVDEIRTMRRKTAASAKGKARIGTE